MKSLYMRTDLRAAYVGIDPHIINFCCSGECLEQVWGTEVILNAVCSIWITFSFFSFCKHPVFKAPHYFPFFPPKFVFTAWVLKPLHVDALMLNTGATELLTS